MGILERANFIILLEGTNPEMVHIYGAGARNRTDTEPGPTEFESDLINFSNSLK